ncbi:hypothetical protein Tco_0933029 [Tanacetum coccineum]
MSGQNKEQRTINAKGSQNYEGMVDPSHQKLKQMPGENKASGREQSTTTDPTTASDDHAWRTGIEALLQLVNNEINDAYGDWMTRWDEFYERNYYYNRVTRVKRGYGKMDSNEENSNLLQHVAVSDGLSSDVSPVKIHNEHLVEPELTADRVDNVLTSSIVGYSDL